jgi:hypothetical protein
MLELNSQKIRRKIYESYENSDLVRLMKEINQIDPDGQQLTTPIINGYKLIKEPNAEDILKNLPNISWSEISSIKSNDKKFSMPDTPTRETIAHSLAVKSSRKIKEDQMYIII